MTGEYGETQTRFLKWTQDGKEEWVIDHKGDWGWERRSNYATARNTVDYGHSYSLCTFFIDLLNSKQATH